ncbi:MAG: hypothetical protein MZV63_34265 [Marinilabiliales bacterium]|nr:hypothetical protein [Marinilabiliales bacterium]
MERTAAERRRSPDARYHDPEQGAPPRSAQTERGLRQGLDVHGPQPRVDGAVGERHDQDDEDERRGPAGCPRRSRQATENTGASPATSTMAGIVNGSRQKNSITRRTPGRRRCTHTIVGTRRHSIPATVSTASSSVTAIAPTSSV